MYTDVDGGKLGFGTEDKVWGGVSTHKAAGQSEELIPRMASSCGGATVSFQYKDSVSKYIQYNIIYTLAAKPRRRGVKWRHIMHF